MADLERAKQGTEHLPIRYAIVALDEVSKEFAKRRMNAALDENLRGQTLSSVSEKVGE